MHTVHNTSNSHANVQLSDSCKVLHVPKTTQAIQMTKRLLILPSSVLQHLISVRASQYKPTLEKALLRFNSFLVSVSFVTIFTSNVIYAIPFKIS